MSKRTLTSILHHENALTRVVRILTRITVPDDPADYATRLYLNGREEGFAVTNINTHRVVIFAENRNSDALVVYVLHSEDYQKQLSQSPSRWLGDVAHNGLTESAYRVATYFPYTPTDRRAVAYINRRLRDPRPYPKRGQGGL